MRENEREIPFLVEVKNKNDKSLVWREDYLQSLQRFADLVKMPLLVAWKPHGMWVLVETAHFEKRQTAFHLTFDTAAKNNFMSRLFGNVWLSTDEQFRFEIGMQILEPVDPAVEVIPEGEYHCVIREAGFWTQAGKLPGNLASELFPILLACGADPRTERTGDGIKQIFPTQHESMFNLSDLLLAQLSWLRDSDKPIDWALELRSGLPASKTNFVDMLNRSLETKVLRYVLRQEPAVVPDFLQPAGTRPSQPQSMAGDGA